MGFSKLGTNTLCSSSLLTAASTSVPRSMNSSSAALRSKQRDQGPDTLLRKRSRGFDHFFDGLRLLGGTLPPKEWSPSHSGERPPNVGLEDDDDDDRQIGEHRIQNRGDGHQADATRKEVADKNETESDGHLHRAGSTQDDQSPVDENRDEADVQHVVEHVPRAPLKEGRKAGAQLAQDAGEHLDHRSPLPASRRACVTRISWRIAKTSWTRTASTPAAAQIATAAAVPPRRLSAGGGSPPGLGASSAMKDFREGPTSTRYPVFGNAQENLAVRPTGRLSLRIRAPGRARPTPVEPRHVPRVQRPPRAR